MVYVVNEEMNLFDRCPSWITLCDASNIMASAEYRGVVIDIIKSDSHGPSSAQTTEVRYLDLKVIGHRYILIEVRRQYGTCDCFDL